MTSQSAVGSAVHAARARSVAGKPIRDIIDTIVS